VPNVKINGINTHLQILGQGPPVVMLHGLLIGSLATWYFTAAPALAKQNKVYLYDLRGHGRSQKVTAGYDLKTMADDLHALLEEYGVGKSILVGHSYGGLVALYYTIHNAERVKGLALVDVPLPPSDLASVMNVGGFDTSQLLKSLPKYLQVTVQRSSRQARRLYESVEFLLSQTNLLTDLKSTDDLTDQQLSEVVCPVLCLFGQNSHCLPVGQRLARVMPNAQLRILPGGHYLPIEQPSLVCQHLEKFINHGRD